MFLKNIDGSISYRLRSVVELRGRRLRQRKRKRLLSLVTIGSPSSAARSHLVSSSLSRQTQMAARSQVIQRKTHDDDVRAENLVVGSEDLHRLRFVAPVAFPKPIASGAYTSLATPKQIRRASGADAPIWGLPLGILTAATDHRQHVLLDCPWHHQREYPLQIVPGQSATRFHSSGKTPPRNLIPLPEVEQQVMRYLPSRIAGSKITLPHQVPRIFQLSISNDREILGKLLGKAFINPNLVREKLDLYATRKFTDTTEGEIGKRNRVCMLLL
ncbi:hypothetical protein F4776DRAFT_670748 [Hypoxylon sp. NC0597]|nr:hypothetical protein F4776DRAFT_670748 [Hypoxylon sp. NC0597]